MKNITIYCPNCGIKHRIKFLYEIFDVEFKCSCGENIRWKVRIKNDTRESR